jgi:hypothetical protein
MLLPFAVIDLSEFAVVDPPHVFGCGSTPTLVFHLIDRTRTGYGLSHIEVVDPTSSGYRTNPTFAKMDVTQLFVY